MAPTEHASQNLRLALSSALINSLKALSATGPVLETEEHLVWRRSGPAAWSGSYELRPTLARRSLAVVPTQPDARRLQQVIATEYPRCLGPVGTTESGLRHLGPADFTRAAVADYFRRTGHLDVDTDTAEAVVRELVEFFTAAEVSFECTAPLINFRCELEGPIAGGDGLALHRLSDAEVTSLRGGPTRTFGIGRQSFDMPDWAARAAFKAPIVFDNPEAGPGRLALIQAKLDRLVLGIRTFQTGPVGYETMLFRPTRFAALLAGASRSFDHEYIPLAEYRLPADQVGKFQRHLQDIAKPLHPAVEVAASRLAMAEIRRDPRDRIIDAVIGLESLLLSSVSDKRYRGELRFRFALNYAMLQPRLDRRDGHKLALSLYDLRSQIAHGSAIQEIVKVGREKKRIEALAIEACDSLRALVVRFLSEAPGFGPSESGYWEARYFE